MKTNSWILMLACIAWSTLPIGCGRGPSVEKDTAEKVSENEVVLDEKAMEAGRIKTETVSKRNLSVRVEAPGEIAVNPRCLVDITARVAGRIENINAYAGDRVRAGQELLTLYSPEFFSAQSEFLQMTERVRNGNAARIEEREANRRLLRSAAGKLKIMGMTDSEMDSLGKGKEIQWLLPVRAPFAGSLLESSAVNGAFVEAGTRLAKIADLTSLWVLANVHENDLASVQIGSMAEVRTTAFPGSVFRGKLTAVGGLLDEQNRTVQTRIEIANPSGLLKPGMYANTTLESPHRIRVLAVPEQAIRKVEGNTVVFVSGNGRAFRKRIIETGRTLDGFVEVVQGLKEGETVAADGSFVLKSEFLKSSMEGE